MTIIVPWPDLICTAKLYGPASSRFTKSSPSVTKYWEVALAAQTLSRMSTGEKSTLHDRRMVWMLGEFRWLLRVTNAILHMLWVNVRTS